MPELPTGTVTFLFTDIAGSTTLWELVPTAMRQALIRETPQRSAGHGSSNEDSHPYWHNSALLDARSYCSSFSERRMTSVANTRGRKTS